MEAAPIRINFEIFNVARGLGDGKGWLQLLIVSGLCGLDLYSYYNLESNDSLNRKNCSQRKSSKKDKN